MIWEHDCRGLEPAQERRCIHHNADLGEWQRFAGLLGLIILAGLVLFGVAL